MGEKFGNQMPFSATNFADAWADYWNEVGPEGAPQFQIDACKRSFLAGALAYSVCMRVAALAGENEDEKLANLKILDDSIHVLVSDWIFSASESYAEADAEGAGCDPVGMHVHSFDAPELNAEDMTDLQAHIQAFIDERRAQRAKVD